MENPSPSVQEQISSLLKMGGMTLIALAIPVGAGVAVRGIKQLGGERAIILCFSIIVAASSVGFLLILASGKIMKHYVRRLGEKYVADDEEEDDT